MRDILISAILFLIPFGATAQVVNIPDAKLRAAINTELSKSANALVTRAEMATLTRLQQGHADISDLTGLEFATNIREIRLNNGTVSDLSPLSGLQRLRKLELRKHIIQDLSPIKGLNIEWLIVNDNLISDLSPIEGFVNLVGLEISDNVIDDFTPIARFARLERIWMSQNPPADLSSFTELTHLRAFRSWGTSILDVTPLTQLPKLRILDICGGDLSDISALEGMTGLQELYLAGNEITDITPLASLTGLTRLSLKHNRVSDISPMARLHNLKWIELQDNDILDFSPLDDFPENVVIHRTDNPGFTRPAPKLRGPWLWMIVPTGNRLGASAASSGVDFLAQASGRKVTEASIARNSAIAGDPVGDKVWTVSQLSEGGNNLNRIANITGLGFGDIDYHVAYGLLTFDSPREQITRMFVGSGDAVKVWLNGKVVHTKAVNRDATDYQENFPVTLKEGMNILFVAVYEGMGWWSGFFGFEAETDFAVIPPDTPISPIGQKRISDVNSDAAVNILDLILVSQEIGRNKFNPAMDVNSDDVVNIQDILFVARRFDTVPGAPAAGLSSGLIRALLMQAQVVDDGTLAVRQGIANLEQLLALFVPGETALLHNYPNPFNPETWIPYRLAEPADVTLDIYAANGILVRTLALGYQPAGIYQDRSRAAYWDGKNQLGELVASGIYFYTLTAGDFAATRKMLIMK